MRAESMFFVMLAALMVESTFQWAQHRSSRSMRPWSFQNFHDSAATISSLSGCEEINGPIVSVENLKSGRNHRQQDSFRFKWMNQKISCDEKHRVNIIDPCI